MKYNPVGVGEVELNTIVLDLNGTLTIKGKVPQGVHEKLEKLKKLGYTMYLFSGDQRGTAAGFARDLDIELKYAKTTEEKEKCMLELDFAKAVAIGNARIDIGAFKHAKVRIATLQAEGIHSGILPYVDIIAPSMEDALDILIDPDTFNATMRL